MPAAAGIQWTSVMPAEAGIQTGSPHLVHFEMHVSMETAISREKQPKKWRRKWKLELIEAGNPEWRDLWPELLG